MKAALAPARLSRPGGARPGSLNTRRDKDKVDRAFLARLLAARGETID